MSLPRVCWHPESRPKVCETEALDVRESIFRATHFPIPITKASSLDSGGSPYTEQELLSDILAPAREHLFCVVRGAPGSGKSHLIHWLFRSVRRKGATDLPLHVIEIPRRCSTLADVVREIIKGFDTQSDHLRRIKSQLTTGTLQPNLEGAKVQVLDELGRVLDFKLWCQNPLEHDLTADEAELAPSLPPFLADSAVRKFLQNGASKLESMAKRLVGTGSVEDLEQGDWSANDLKMDARTVSTIPNRNARELATQLQADDDIRRLVARLLNKALRVAAPNLVGLKYGDLKAALLQIRELLAGQGKQLLLLIEDLSVSQGLDMELIESLIIKKGDNKDKNICTIRSVVGVTPEDADRLRDNIRDRADFFVLFNAALAEQSQVVPRFTEQDLLAFTTRYLNTARFKLEDLDKWDRNADPAENDPGSACAKCPDRKACFEAFGEFQESGLFPFNPTAIRRLYQNVTKNPNLPFNPRKLVRSVLNQFLEEAERTLPETSFPAPALADFFSLTSVTPQAQVELQKKNPIRFDQARTASELYSDSPEKGDIPASIAKILSLVGATATVVVPPRPEAPKPEKPKVAESETTKWLNKGEIAEDTVNKWRNTIRGAIENWHDWSADEYAWAFDDFEQSHIHFEGQRLHRRGNLEHEIKRTPDNALAIDILMGRNFDTLEKIQHVSAFVARQVREVKDLLASTFPLDEDRKAIAVAVSALSAGVLMRGQHLTLMPLPQAGNSLFEPISGAETTSRKIATWRDLRLMAEWDPCRRWLLKRITRTKGTGDVVLLDLGLCIPHLRAASKALPEWASLKSAAPNLPDEVAPLLDKLTANFDRICEAHRTHVLETFGDITGALGKAKATDVRSRLREVISNLQDAAALNDDRRELSCWYPHQADALAGPALAEQLDLCSTLSGLKHGQPSTVAALGKTRLDLLLDIAGALSKAQHLLSTSSAFIDRRLRQEGVPDLEALEKDLLALHNDLLDSLKKFENGRF